MFIDLMTSGSFHLCFGLSVFTCKCSCGISRWELIF